jgi:ferrochelatase
MDALADMVREHLASGRPYGPLYRTRCPGCVNPQCRQIVNPVG